MRVLIVPAAGEGRRFKEAGYAEPKPFIQLPSKYPGTKRQELMVERACAPFEAHVDRIHLVFQRDHVGAAQGDIDEKTSFHTLRHTTGGAALTILSCIGQVPNDAEVIIANSDQFFEDHSVITSWISQINRHKPAGSILTFAPDPGDTRWSYVRQWADCVEVREKEPISNIATCGVYYWSRFSDLVSSIVSMVCNDDRHNGEFYLAPAFNYGFFNNVLLHDVGRSAFFSVGTPELLQRWEAWYAANAAE